MRTSVASAALAVVAAMAPTSSRAQVVRYVHFQDGARDAWGILEGQTVQRLSAAPWAGGTRTGQSAPFASLKLLPPAAPSTAVIINVNYPSGVTGQPRQAPTLITLPPRAFVGGGSPVLRPVEAQDVRAEPTVAVVIGRMARNVSAAQARQYIFGVAPALDVTAMDWRPAGSQWTRAKGNDSFKPIGPYLVSGVDLGNLTINGKRNGQAIEPVRTSEMIWDFDELVSYVSRFMTLHPGDVILAGTAGASRTVAIQPGDALEVEIAGVGTLATPVAAAPPIARTLPPAYRPPR
jgi:2-keto-4-pentenoate hydratase/2-oxohepta-3-ene-1,7-dioic acid hydratase in catechol pathway